MRIVSYNVNGLRSALSKGLLDWVAASQPDVLCLQEIKAGTAPLDVSGFEALGYHAYLHPAQKPGYSGVATFCRAVPQAVVTGCGEPLYDDEGRVLRLDFDGFSVLNTYMPSGTSGPERQAFKVKWLHYFRAYVARLRQDPMVPPLIIGGDYNCCLAQPQGQPKQPRLHARGAPMVPGFPGRWLPRLVSGAAPRGHRPVLVVELPGRLAPAQRGLAPRPPATRPSAAAPPARRRPLARCRALRPLPGLDGAGASFILSLPQPQKRAAPWQQGAALFGLTKRANGLSD